MAQLVYDRVLSAFGSTALSHNTSHYKGGHLPQVL